MSEADIEREQVQWVFGLTGGELDDKPLQFRAPGHLTGELRDQEWAYHYDGLPEWASSDYPDRFETGVDYFTLVEVGCSYGSSAPEWLITTDGKLYVRMAQYANSGETECPEGPSGMNETVGEGHTEGMECCPLCEASKGEEHGYIYIGDGCESVYKHVEFSCEACGLTRTDITPEAPMCDCEVDDDRS